MIAPGTEQNEAHSRSTDVTALRALQRILAPLTVACLFASCAHEKENEAVAPQLAVHTVDMRLAIDFRHDGHAYDISSAYEDDFGHLFQLDTMRFLLSKAYAVNDDGDVLADYSNVFMLVDAAGSTHFDLGPLTADHLHEIKFNIGLEPLVNHADPSVAEPPLNDLSMHSSSNAEGYCSLQVTGRVDSNADGVVDETDQRFSHRCTGDDLFSAYATEVHANLPESGELTGWLPVDMRILLSDIDLLNTPSSTGSGSVNAAWMQRLKNSMEQEH